MPRSRTSSSPSLPRRSHALGGCHTCRRRHVKCDQKRPACRTCRGIGVTCEGYSEEVRWMWTKDSSSSKVEISRPGTRRHLYAETSRASMGAAMSIDLKAGSIDASLAEIDSRSRSPSRATSGDIVIGPFAVLDFTSSTHIQPSGSISAVQEAQIDHSSASVTTAPTIPAPMAVNEFQVPSPGLSGIDSLAHMDDFLHWSDLLGLNPDQPGLSSALDPADIFTFHAGPELAGQGSQLYSSHFLPAQPGSLSDRMELTGPRPVDQIHTPQQTPMKDPSAMLDLLVDAPFLFKHFQDNVLPQMMAMPLGEKSPWKILNLPTAVVTYSDITFLGTRNTSHARLANLYGILACAAIHLTLPPLESLQNRVDHWRQLSEQTYQQAKDHMQISLQCETKEPHKAKYKDQLMAICGLIQFSVLSGQQQHARCFMVDAERLLRIRGLPKRRISQKARLLHHVYTWLRIVSESTYVLHDYTPSASFLEALDSQFRTPPSIDAVAISDKNPRLDDFLRLDARNSDSDLNIDEPKDLEVGLHDIHLQDSRVFSETMYKQIYGIPETWLSLVSQTTRLANVMETFRNTQASGKHVSLEAWETLQRRSVRLENMICAFDLRRAEGISETTESSKPHRHMLHALSASLVIFFYRRIRQVHPAVLGGHVDNTIAALEKFFAALSPNGHTGPGTIWPTFVAGCEAITSTRREAILKCLEKADSIRSFAAFSTARNILGDIWRKQDAHLASNSGEALPTWIEILKHEMLWPLFC